MRDHSKTHNRPWTCAVADCEYSEIGFVSRQMRDRHLDKVHQADKDPGPDSSTAVGGGDGVLLLKTLMTENKLTEQIATKILKNCLVYTPRDVLAAAASSGRYDQMQLLWAVYVGSGWRKRPSSRSSDKDINQLCYMLESSLRHKNYEALEWIQAESQRHKRYANDSCMIYAWEALMESDEPEMLYRKYAERLLLKTAGIEIKGAIKTDVSAYGPRVVRATRGEPLKETVLLSLWNSLNGMATGPGTRKSLWSRALRSVASSTFSIRLTKWLIEHGASVRVYHSGREIKVLEYAARKDSLESANFMRYLLYHADFYRPLFEAREVSRMEGPKGIHKWLGVSWEELIEQAEEARTEDTYAIYSRRS